MRAFLVFTIIWLASILVAGQCQAQQKAASNWIDQAIIYGISPTFISSNHGAKLQDIRSRLKEIKDLGANTIWLQPIYKSAEGEEGYDVTDYFQILPDLGTKADFSDLVNSAHKLNLKIILDFVPNHLSAKHPFVQDVIQNGKQSPYYGMFMTEPDNAAYSNFYQWAEFGEVKFLVYFWKELININFDNKQARDYIHDAALYWLKTFSIDGYRFDAAWGPVARNPKFMIQLKNDLKAVKPDFMIVAEDKSGQPDMYRHTQHPYSAEIFDLVYDWTSSGTYISEWSWAPNRESIFDLTASQNVAGEFRKALVRSGRESDLKAKVLRFIENNDQERFIKSHSLAETKLAAALTFTLPGVPLIYYGQEVGYGSLPEDQLQCPSYPSNTKIKSHDHLGLWDYYKFLTQLRSLNPELSRGSYFEINIEPESAKNQVLAFERSFQNQKFIVVANLDESPVEVKVSNLQAKEKLAGNQVQFFKNGVRLNLPK